MTAPVLRLEDLTVRFGRSERPVVSGVSFEIAAGECLALVGESGSGKSVTARSLIGLAGATASVTAGSMTLDGRELKDLSPRAWQRVRGAQIGFILQDALVSLDPLRTVGREIDDALRLHTRLAPWLRRERVLELLAAAGIRDPELRADQRAGELSGGLRQRALIASAIALSPPMLIADEPTTSLDVAVQSQVLDLLDQLRADGAAVLLISHDLSVVARISQRVLVMQGGVIVESGETAAILERPTHPYTRQLLDAIPARHAKGTRLSAEPVRGFTPTSVEARHADRATEPQRQPDAPALELLAVSKSFRTTSREPFLAVDAVSLDLPRGTTLGLVGESGSGKTTTARIALGIERPDTGEVSLLGERWSGIPEQDRRSRRHLIGAIYQDALSSFDPRWSVGQLLADALSDGRSIRVAPARDRIAGLLRSVGLNPDLMRRRTLSLSGGQRQRVSIARAIAPGPEVIVCDEPVSSLDVSIQARVLDLLADLQDSLGLSYLFISHDLGVIRHVSDSVAVMSGGRIVERGETEQIFAEPTHPYTRHLLRSIEPGVRQP